MERQHVRHGLLAMICNAVMQLMVRIGICSLNILADDRRTRDKQTWITTVDMQRAEHNESAELLHCTYAKLYDSKPVQSNPSRIHNHTTTLHKQHHVHMRTMFALLWCIQLPSQSISNQIGGMTHPSDSRSSLSSIWYRREEGWWMVVRTALPPCASCRSVATKCMAVVLSRPTQHVWLVNLHGLGSTRLNSSK